MTRLAIVSTVAMLMTSALAQAAEPIALRDMGSFHVGGSVDVVDLPKVGIAGNSHILMMDKNNAEIAALIQKWLEGKGLTK